MHLRSCIVSVICFMLASACALAGDNPKVVRAVRVATPPKIDGVLDDDVWKQAVPATDFIQRDPEEGKPASERSEIRILYDDEAIYFGCMMYDSDPSKIVSRLTRRDDEAESDRASIRIDAYHDHQTGYEFTFNVSGVKIDVLQYDDANREDNSWDPVWDLETRITPEGWAAEVKIPFRILRYKTLDADTAENVWGVNFLRYISRKQESDRWAFTPKSESGFISRFGHLLGLRNLPNPSRVEALPFVVGKQRYAPANGVLHRTEEFLGNAGLDLKYGLSSNFLIDATVNPDFGQVEADPAVLNLTALETFYPEKRPFFIEGTQILHFTTFGGTFGPGMFYSRRIGRAISPDEVDTHGGYIESMPQSTTILGAAKLTGKTNGGLSIGVLEASTKEERATVVDSAGNRFEETLEPFANYNVFRVKQDILENSSVGSIVTLTTRNGRAPALTNGYDWNINLAQSTYNITGFLALSHTMQAGDRRLDGSAGKLNISRAAGTHWLWSTGYDFTSPKYNINDAGFFFSPNDHGSYSTVTYKEDQPGAVLRNYSVNAYLHERWNFDRLNLFRELGSSWNSTFSNYWSMSIGYSYEYGDYDMYETRGNGPYAKPQRSNIGFDMMTDSRHAVVFGGGQRIIWNNRAMRESQTQLGVEVKPASWMSWELQAEYQQVRDQAAWGRNSALSGLSIFGDRSTDQYNFTLRNTSTFTRELTLQIYGQLFLAKGKYENERQLIDPAHFGPVLPSEPPLSDFNEHFFNTNVVLRWEYMPGSTVYLVWSQARSDDFGPFVSSFSTDLDGTFRVPPSNVLLVKINYWLMR